MNEEVVNELQKIVEAVTIESDTSFRIGDERIEVDCLNPATSDNTRYLDSPLTHDLQNAIYRRFYTRQEPQKDGSRDSTEHDWKEHLKALETANAAADDWDRNWQVIGVGRNGVYAAKSQRVVFLANGFFVLSKRSKELKEGVFVDGRRFPDSDKAQAGFYIGYSSIAPVAIGHRKSIRFYWNCTPRGAVEIFREVSTRFNRFQIPYEMKCPLRPDAYSRRDSLVLYLKPPYFRAASEQVRRIHPEVARHLNKPAPLFTRPVAPGLGSAETPPGEVSFGVHRCGLVAHALVRAHRERVDDSERGLQFVVDEFAKHHISLERPWLDHGEHDPFGVGEFMIS